MLESVEWGEFKYGKFFRNLRIKKKYKKLDLLESGATPVFSSQTTDHGLMGYINEDPTYVVGGDVNCYIIFGDHTRTFYLIDESFSVADNVKVLVPKHKISNHVLFFLVSSWRGAIPELGYSRHWSVAEKAHICVPITPKGEPDYVFMKSFIAELEAQRIAELEAQRIAELEAYLLATGLADYVLTPAEEEALKLIGSACGGGYDKVVHAGGEKIYRAAA